jgi:hypothetical protein
MKKIVLLFFCFASIVKSYSQIIQGNWLVGGSGSFTAYKILDEKNNELQLSPNIGYFFVDKLAAGLKVSYTHVKGAGSTFSSKKRDLFFGPFARYYFLNPDRPFNILLEGIYQYGLEKAKGYGSTPNKYTLSNFSFYAGPVIYFNSSVGLEFLVGYAQSKFTNEDYHQSQFQVGIGLQVHLEKE